MLKKQIDKAQAGWIGKHGYGCIVPCESAWFNKIEDGSFDTAA